MNKLVLLFCIAPIFASEYVRMSEHEVRDNEIVTPQPVEAQPAEVLARYAQASQDIFAMLGSEVPRSNAAYVGSGYNLHLVENRDAKLRDAMQVVKSALALQHREAFYDAAEMTIRGVSMHDHALVMPILEAHHFDAELNAPEIFRPQEVRGINFFLAGDACAEPADPHVLRALDLQKMHIMQKMLKEKQRRCKNTRESIADWKACGPIMPLTCGGCIAASWGLGTSHAGAELATDAFCGSMCGLGVGFLVCGIASVCLLNPYCKSRTPDKFPGASKALLSEIVARDPRFIAGALERLETVAESDEEAAKLLNDVYDAGLLVEYCELQVQRHAQRAQPAQVASEPHAVQYNAAKVSRYGLVEIY